MAERKLDIFQLLQAVDDGDIDFYQNLDQSIQSEFHPLVVMRWMSSAGSKEQKIYLNHFLNRYVFSLYKHKDLTYKLMVACSDQKSKRYKWIGRKSKTGSKPNTCKAISDFYSVSLTHAFSYSKMMNLDDVLEICSSMGYSKEETDKIKKEYK